MSSANPKPGAQFAVTVGATSINVIKASPHRTALTFAAIGGTVFITDDPTATATNGLPIVAGQVPFTICQCHAGAWVKKALQAIADGAGRTLVVIEGNEPAGAGDYSYGDT